MNNVKCEDCDNDMVVALPKVLLEISIPYTNLEFSIVNWNNPKELYCPSCIAKEAIKLEKHLHD